MSKVQFDPTSCEVQRDSYPHYCPGARIGRRMAAIALTAVLEPMPNIRRL